MLNTSKLLAIAIAAIAALAFAPSVASAQTVELEQETLGHCPAAVVMVHHRPTAATATCSVHAITAPGTTFDFYQHVSGVGEVAFSQCQLEFEAAFAEDGSGFIYDQVVTPEGGACGREPCDEAEGSEAPHRNNEWPAQLNEVGPSTAEQETLRFTFCLYAHNGDPASEGTQGTSCTLDLNVEHVGHAYELATPPDVNGNGGAPCINLGGVVEFEGHFITTAPTAEHPGFEIHHLDDA